jgi:general secretion pathway protein L
MIGLRHINDLSRADFLTSVGLYIMADRIRMVRLRKSFLTVSVLGQENREIAESDSRPALSELTGWVADDVKEIALRAEGEARERALRQALLSLLPHINTARDQIYICLSPEQAIVQQVLLPLAAQENLQRVLDYEIERQLPFKREDVCYDYLPAGKRGEKLCVYVFALPKRTLDSMLALLHSLGIQPRGVETTVTALANYLLFTGQVNGQGAAVVAGYPDGWEMIGIEAKAKGWQPAADLLFCHRFPKAEWAHGPAKELLLECSNQVPQLFHCGDPSTLNGAAGQLARAEDLLELSSPRLKGFESVRAADALPAVGAALHGVREGTLRANFLHHEGEADSNKRLSLLNAVLLGVLLLALIVWGASYPVKQELRLRQLESENRKLDPAVQALRREEGELEKLRKEANIITSLEQRRGEVLRVMDELSRIMPNNAYLSNLRHRAGVVEMQGSAESASALIPVLERSPVFVNVGFNAPSNRGRDNRETFSLKADIEKARDPVKGLTPEASKSAPAVKEPKSKP